MGPLGCILSCFYIKPQPLVVVKLVIFVVSYLVSTSNHNYELEWHCRFYVVSYLVSTSNHNFNADTMRMQVLYLILFLHQTTTSIFIL